MEKYQIYQRDCNKNIVFGQKLEYVKEGTKEVDKIREFLGKN